MARAVTRRRRRYFSRPRFHHKVKMTIPMAVVAGFVPVAVGVWNRRTSGTQIGQYLQAGFTGLSADGSFHLANFKTGLLPIIAGFAVHSIAGKLGINRAIARTGIPLIRI